MSFIDFTFQEHLGDKLSDIDALINWESFRPTVKDIYINKTEKGGYPNKDEVMIIKILVLQECQGLSDSELERQITERISFHKFLGFSDTIPDYSTVWYFREKLAKSGKDKKIWKEL